MDRIVRLSGEHDTLPLAELRALLAVYAPGAKVLWLNPSVVRINHYDTAGVDAALARLTSCHEWSEYWTHTAGGDEGLARVHEQVGELASGDGSIAVRATRGGHDRSISRAGIEQTLGAVLAGAGHPVDLREPDNVITAWIHGDSVVVGHLLGEADRSRFERRTATDRDHFSPITLHPLRAASLLHLSQTPPGGRVLDPFCGTGGFVLESSLAGFNAWGSDYDADMVQGTMQTLTDGADEALPGTVFVADIGDAPDLVEGIDSIVTDLPYGKSSNTDGEGVAALYQRAFAAFAAILPAGGFAVIGCADPELGRGIASHGFTILEHHEEFVHRSMTRHYFVAQRTEAD